MHVPTYGSSAYQYDRPYYEAPKKTVRKVRVVRKKKGKLRIGSGVLLATAVVLAFCLIFRYSQIIEKAATVRKLQGELDTIHAQIVAKQFEIDRNLDLKTIETEAITRLGMQRPTKAQTVYLNMGREDYVEAPNLAEEKNPLKSFAQGIKDCFHK